MAWCEPPAQVTSQVRGVAGVAVFLCFLPLLGAQLPVARAGGMGCQAGQRQGFVDVCPLSAKISPAQALGERKVQDRAEKLSHTGQWGSLAKNSCSFVF